MLQISPDKAAHVIIRAREYDRPSDRRHASGNLFRNDMPGLRLRSPGITAPASAGFGRQTAVMTAISLSCIAARSSTRPASPPWAIRRRSRLSGAPITSASDCLPDAGKRMPGRLPTLSKPNRIR